MSVGLSSELIVVTTVCSHNLLTEALKLFYFAFVKANVSASSVSSFLYSYFNKRVVNNRNYSIRAFARDMLVSPANLSKVLRGQRGFSHKTLTIVARKLQLNESEAQLLRDLTDSQFAKSVIKKNQAKKRLLTSHFVQLQIEREKVELISNWQHLALLSLLEVKGFRSDLDWMAGQLKLTKRTVKEALQNLINVGAVKVENGIYKSRGYLFVDPKGIPSEAVKEFHRQVIGKAKEAIDSQGLDERELFSLMFCFDITKMKAAKAKISKFRQEFEEEFGPNIKSEGQHVYGLSLQFFNLTTGNLIT